MKPLILFTLLSLLPTGISLAGEHAADEPIIVRDDEGYEFTIEKDPSANTLRLTTKRAEAGLPKNPSITLFYSGKTGRKLKLQPLSPLSQMPRDSLPQYQGKLSTEAQSFTGLELKFELGSGKKKKLRWDSQKASR